MPKLLSNPNVPVADSANNATYADVIGNKTDTVAGDSIVAGVKRIEATIGGAAAQLRVNQSETGGVEEDSIVGFGISIFDIDSGAVTSGNIDITGISAVLEKSTGGGAFSTGGITQPTFAKANGLVSVDYRFLAAEWEIGDIYKLVVGGITATIGGDTAYVKTLIWSNIILEEVNIEAKIDEIPSENNSKTFNATALQSIQDEVEDALEAEDLDHLLKIDGATQKYPENCATDSIIAKLIVKADPAVPSQYDNSTDSLEAISDKVTDVQTDIGDPSARTNLQSIEAMMGNPDAASKSLYGNLGDFVGQTNLQTLLAALAIPDTAGKGLFVELATDRLDSGTHGLAALKTLIDAIQTDLGNPSSRTNLQTILALLGNPDTAGKTVYEAIKNIRETAIDGSSLPITNTLSDILHKDGSYTYDNTSDSLEAISDKVTDLQTDVGDYSAQSNLQSLLAALGIPDVAAKPLYTCLVTDRLDDATFGLSPIQVQVDDIQDKVDGTDATPTAYRREEGVTQIKEFSITAAANAGLTTIATITSQPCLIKSIVVHADTAQTGDMTTCAVEGGASQVIEFIGAGDAIQANLDAIDKQISWDGKVRLAATKTITINLQGTGATAVDLTISIEYAACVDGGYLV